MSASRSTASGPAALPHQRDRHDGRLVRRLGGGGRARALGADVPQGDPRDRQRRGCASVRVRHDRVVRQAVVLLVRSGAIRRRACGALIGVGAAPLLLLAGFSGETEVFRISLFLLALIAASFFVDGGFANLAPFTPEVFPTSMRTQGLELLGVQRRGWVVGPLRWGRSPRPATTRSSPGGAGRDGAGVLVPGRRVVARRPGVPADEAGAARPDLESLSTDAGPGRD